MAILTLAKTFIEGIRGGSTMEWRQKGLNSYKVVMRPSKEDKTKKDVYVYLERSLIGEKIGFEWTGKSSEPLDVAQDIIDEYERPIKLDQFLQPQGYEVDWNHHKERSNPHRKKDEGKPKIYNWEDRRNGDDNEGS